MNKKDIRKVFGILKTKRKTKGLLRKYSDYEEKMFTALASEKSLAKDWNSKKRRQSVEKIKT